MADEVFEKNKWPCPGDPKALLGQPIGMYHCEYCGEMQIAGMEHLAPQFPEQWTGEFPKVEMPDGPSEIDYPCSTCHAQPGEPCKMSTMPYQPVDYFHAGRGS